MSTDAARDRRLRAVEARTARARRTTVAPLVVPNIMEFVTSPRYLNRALYPRQATLLKIITGSVELLTDYDRAVIAEWEAGFVLVSGDGATSYRGSRGLCPAPSSEWPTCTSVDAGGSPRWCSSSDGEQARGT